MIENKDKKMQDNLLIEWILALEGLVSSQSRIEKIIPIMIGKKASGSVAVGDLFVDKYESINKIIFNNIVDAIPSGDVNVEDLVITSVDKAVELLMENHIIPSPRMRTRTLKSIIGDILDCSGIKLSSLPENHYVKHSCAQINGILAECITGVKYVEGINAF